MFSSMNSPQGCGRRLRFISIKICSPVSPCPLRALAIVASHHPNTGTSRLNAPQHQQSQETQPAPAPTPSHPNISYPNTITTDKNITEYTHPRIKTNATRPDGTQPVPCKQTLTPAHSNIIHPSRKPLYLVCAGSGATLFQGAHSGARGVGLEHPRQRVHAERRHCPGGSYW